MAGVAQGYTVEKLLGRPLNEVEKKHAPTRLWAIGDLSLASTGARVAVVGARKASSEGARRAARLAGELSAQGVVIVSGLAEGIDTSAHKSAIASGGRTIAVLGTPLNETYPKQNAELQQQIMFGHLAVSQFDLGEPVLRQNFPRRNRLMALLVDATVIVEASDSSGSLSQGWEAIRLGRPLFLLRSVAEKTALKWPGEMLAYGASILSATEELLEVLLIGATSDQAVFAF
ncbi:MAG TPA: DNA-processing protein DprA [Thermoanaerobaculia bacterium]|jgi:DNA processing protein|nr:DNA-processing protein DprA [Thermoanaerobaculia bacterium]